MNMDRHKYRAWFNFDEHGWMMIDLKGFYFESPETAPDAITLVGVKYGGPYEGIFGKDCFIMQCTGLKDSTKWEELTLEEQEAWCRHSTSAEWEGRLIYEGDVVEIVLDDYNNRVPNAAYDDARTPKVKNICEVRYRLHGGFVALVRQPVRYKGNRLHLKNGRDKVLGNIYEHPSLLEVEK